jgi:hypothetical protein
MAMTMPESLESRGICGVCALGRDCELADGCETPMMNCEEFVPDPALVRDVVNLAIVRQAHVTQQSRSRRHLGLCQNCEHREDCTFPRNEGGVWHCEEYA